MERSIEGSLLPIDLNYLQIVRRHIENIMIFIPSFITLYVTFLKAELRNYIQTEVQSSVSLKKKQNEN